MSKLYNLDKVRGHAPPDLYTLPKSIVGNNEICVFKLPPHVEAILDSCNGQTFTCVGGGGGSTILALNSGANVRIDGGVRINRNFSAAKDTISDII